MYLEFYWLGVILCILQSGITSGLTLALYGLPRLRLESEAMANNPDAIKILELRGDSHLLLATLIWANVIVNILLVFLTESIMNPYLAFVFTTFVITFLGEIFPQAYIARRALHVGAILVPVVNFYKFIVYPLARPTGLLLDKLIGKENIDFLSEEVIKVMIKKHIDDQSTEIEKLEGIGAINFLSMDDMYVKDEGEVIAPGSIINMPEEKIYMETHLSDLEDDFLQRLVKTRKKWAILTNIELEPIYALNINKLINEKCFGNKDARLQDFCHKPLVVFNPSERLADILLKFKVMPKHPEDDVIHQDIIVFWTDHEKKIITGADIFGRLMRGIAKVK